MNSIYTKIASAVALMFLSSHLHASIMWGAELNARESLVDYLKSKKVDASFEARGKLFHEYFGRHDYKGSASQNQQLFEKLIDADIDAVAKAQGAKRLLETSNSKHPASTINATFSVPDYVFAEGIGINGSYAISVRIGVQNGSVQDRDFQIAVTSASGQVGSLDFTGSVEIVDKATMKPVKQFKLQPAWFDTFGAQGGTSAFRYAEKGTVVKVPAGTKLRARISIHPFVGTPQGMVAHRSKDIEVDL